MNILELLNTNQYKIKKLSKDSTLFHEDDECKYIGIIIKGKVKISSYLSNGNEVIFNQLVENDIFGNNLIFSSNPRYKGDIIAMQNSEIALIEKNELINILSNNKGFLLEYLKIQSNFSKTLNNKIKLLSINSAEERLYYYLHINSDEIEFDSVSDLSKDLYLSREATSRLISKLIKRNKINRINNTIKLVK